MPKATLDIATFDQGILGAVDARDIPLNAAAFSENIDPSTRRGVLRGIPTDGAGAFSIPNGKRFAWIIDEGQWDLVYIDNAGLVKAWEDFYNATAPTARNDSAVAGQCVTVHNKEGFVGQGATQSRHVSYHKHYATPPAGLQWEAGDLATSGISSPILANGAKIYLGSKEGHPKTKMFLAYSLIFDGYQETPLTYLTQGTITGEESRTGGPANEEWLQPEGISIITDGAGEGFIHYILGTVDVTVTVGSFPDRCSHVNYYIGFSNLTSANEPLGYYHLVRTDVVDHTTPPPANFTITIDAALGASYEASSGHPEIVTNPTPGWALACQTEAHHIVGKCTVTGLSDAGNYILKSEPYQFSNFNWISNFLRLPTAPTALIPFAGRVWAFDTHRIYKLDIGTMSIEDIEEGVGVDDPQQVIVTEFGLFFANPQGIYFSDGGISQNISEPILRAYDPGYPEGGWENATHAWGPILMFDQERNALLVLTETSGDVSCFAYSLASRRWDYWKLVTTGTITGAFIDRDRVIYLCTATTPITLFQGGSTRAWKWISKVIDLDAPGRDKTFYEIKITGDQVSAWYREDQGAWTAITLSADGTDAWSGQINSGAGAAALATPWTTVKNIQIRLEGAAGQEVEGMSLIYRSRGAH